MLDGVLQTDRQSIADVFAQLYACREGIEEFMTTSRNEDFEKVFLVTIAELQAILKTMANRESADT